MEEKQQQHEEAQLFSDYNIEVATNYFSNSQKIGEGRYGRVYRGYLQDIEVAIKVLHSNIHQVHGEFHRELKALERMRHPNLVKLVGACVSTRSLVYEFLPNGSVEVCLLENPSILTWQVRTRIVYDICSALVFLHSQKPRPLVHGDIKPANILLDDSFGSKLSDFGLRRFFPERTTMMIPGTGTYIDPEFLRTERLTTACDLYSYGVTVLRLLTGMEASVGIGAKVRTAYKEKSFVAVVDPTAGNWPPRVSEHLARLGLKCCREDGERNPGPADQIMKQLGDLLAASTLTFINNKVTFLDLDLDKNSSNLSSSTSTASDVKEFLCSAMERATNGFSKSSQIGKGAYGSVYKGYLDNMEVAIKMLDATSEQGEEEFNKELKVLKQMRHPNLVKLIGACVENHSLVYEFLSKGSLEDCLKNSPTLLTWQVRTRIVYEICSALIFLHSNKPQPLLHGDLKPANILLDGNFHVKLADFGLCRFLPQGTDTKNFHETKNFQGTEWYIDPDYLETGYLRCVLLWGYDL